MKHADILKKVAWKDLTKLSFTEVMIENNITFPWLVTSWVLAYKGHYFLAMPFSTMFFLTALRQVHNGFHNALGTTKTLTWLTLYLNSILMMAAIHAVQFNHLRHHKYCMGQNDYEGKSAKMPWWKAVLYGPIHIFLIHKITLQAGNRKYKTNVLLELASILVFASIAFFLQINFLVYQVVVMMIGECLTAFFAVWTVHHDCDEATIARTQRTGWKNRITYNMFYHLEHHLFPAVPTIKLPELAKRIDAAVPSLKKISTF